MNNDWKAFLDDAGAELDGDTVSHYGNPGRFPISLITAYWPAPVPRQLISCKPS